MDAWANDEIMLYLTLADVMKLAKLPGDKADWYVTDQVFLKPEEGGDNFVKITFERGRTHNLK